MKHVLLIILCLALLLGLLTAAAQRRELVQDARAARFSSIVPSACFRGCICRLPASSPAARQLLRRIFGRSYIRIVP